MGGKRWLFCSLLLLLFWPVMGQDSLQYDQRSEVYPVKFDTEKLSDYQSDPAFNYKLNQTDSNWVADFWNWLNYLWNSFWKNWFDGIELGSWVVVVVQILKYVFVGGVIALIIWLFIRLNPGRAFIKPNSPPEVLLTEEAELMQRQDLEKLISEALKTGDYRLAIRYSYLFILQQLRERELINYQVDKTNQDYRVELQSTAFASEFNQASGLYDVIWYGDFHIEVAQYKQVQKAFQHLQNRLNSLKHE